MPEDAILQIAETFLSSLGDNRHKVWLTSVRVDQSGIEFTFISRNRDWSYVVGVKTTPTKRDSHPDYETAACDAGEWAIVVIEDIVSGNRSVTKARKDFAATAIVDDRLHKMQNYSEAGKANG